MTNEEAIEALHTVRAYYASLTAGYPKGEDRRGIGDVMCSEIANSCLMAIKALEQQPCEDVISREAVLDYIAKLLSDYLYEEERERLEDFTTYIAEMPSVTPIRPKGRWIEQKDIHKHHYGWSFCSECGAFLISSDGANYCSCCGAEMEVDE